VNFAERIWVERFERIKNVFRIKIQRHALEEDPMQTPVNAERG
jgi:hypothetical protein